MFFRFPTSVCDLTIAAFSKVPHGVLRPICSWKGWAAKSMALATGWRHRTNIGQYMIPPPSLCGDVRRSRLDPSRGLILGQGAAQLRRSVAISWTSAFEIVEFASHLTKRPHNGAEFLRTSRLSDDRWLGAALFHLRANRRTRTALCRACQKADLAIFPRGPSLLDEGRFSTLRAVYGHLVLACWRIGPDRARYSKNCRSARGPTQSIT